MAVTLTYDATLARVRLSATAVTGPTAVVERSTDQIRWTMVRGGAALAVSAGTVALDDYEFVPGVPNWYRVRGTNTQSAQITPVITSVWLKSLARPFLNRPVIVSEVSEISRPSRAGVFDVVGRSLPVVVSGVRGSRRWTMSILTQTDEQTQAVEMLLSSGDVLFVQVPAGSRVPSGYVSVGDTDQRVYALDPISATVLPLTEVAAPGPDVVGATVTCQAILNNFATCTAVRIAFARCVDVLDYVADPDDIIVE